MLFKRIIYTLTFLNGVLFGTRGFVPDHRYTFNFIDTWDVDELILLDITKKKESVRNNYYEVLEDFSKKCFVPITAGGNISNLSEIERLLKCGADKVSINSAKKDEKFILEAVKTFGSNCIIASIDFKKENEKYQIYRNRGTEKVSIDPILYAKNAEKLGMGELLIQSIDKDGTLEGYDIDLINLISTHVNIPVLACGGAGNWEHFSDCLQKTNAAGVCTTNIHHFTNISVINAKNFLLKKRIDIRKPAAANKLNI